MFHQKTSSLRPFAPHGDTWATLDLINLSIYQLKTIGLLSEAAPCSTSLCVEESREFRSFVELSSVVAVVAALDVACLSPALQGVAVYLEQRADLCDAILGAGFHFDVRAHG